MVWYLLRFLFSPTILMYSKRIKIRNANRIRVNQPVLISMNHPNAFLDAIAFSAYFFHPRTYFMARGDAFKKGFIASVLESTGIVPIFRLRDAGIEGVKKNADSFQVVYKLWNKNKKVIVFSEGLCIQERRLRPIQKGTARMAFGFMEQFKKNNFLIVPVSVTYSKPYEFNTEIFYDVGNPINASDFLTIYNENQPKGVNALTKKLEEEMRAITPHLNEKNNDELIEQLQDLYKEEWIKKNGKNGNNLEDVQEFWWAISEMINKAAEFKTEKLEELKLKVNQYHKNLEEEKISDESVRKINSLSSGKILLTSILFFAGYPIYFFGKTLNFGSFYLSSLLSKKLAKTIEFFASFNFVIGSFLYLFFLVGELLLIWLIFNSTFAILIYLVLKFLTGIFGRNFSGYKKETISQFRINRLKNHNKPLLQSFINQRNEIFSEINFLEK